MHFEHVYRTCYWGECPGLPFGQLDGTSDCLKINDLKMESGTCWGGMGYKVRETLGLYGWSSLLSSIEIITGISPPKIFR